MLKEHRSQLRETKETWIVIQNPAPLLQNPAIQRSEARDETQRERAARLRDGEAEVTKLYGVVRVRKEIRRLDISVDNTLRMNILKCRYRVSIERPG